MHTHNNHHKYWVMISVLTASTYRMENVGLHTERKAAEKSVETSRNFLQMDQSTKSYCTRSPWYQKKGLHNKVYTEN